MVTLQKGSSGVLVAALQTRLRALGFAVDVDGMFGKQTDQVVRAFQTREGLRVDGVVGDITAKALAMSAEPVAPTRAPAPMPTPKIEPFVDGWYRNARRCPEHPGRIGAAITAKGAVVHTTDMLPGTMAALLKRWAELRGEGNGATFLLGRRAPTAAELLDEEYPSAGLVQMVPIDRNSNHAGGPNHMHGRVLVPGEPVGWHPNSHYVGIEIDCGGRLTKAGAKFVHPDTGKIIEREDAYIDERGNPWHVVTPYQFEILGQLLDDLDATMARFPAGSKLQPNGTYQMNGVTWAAMPGVRFVGHVTLDPIRKSDPGPQVIAWLRARYGNLG